MDLVNKSNYKIILGSGSSRRKELLGMTGIDFTVNSIPLSAPLSDPAMVSGHIHRSNNVTMNYQNSHSLSALELIYAME